MTAPLMPDFRILLRQHVSSIHQCLEAVPEMKEYAAGDVSLMQYQSTVNKLSHFWSANPPATCNLARRYHDFRESYLHALQSDSGARVQSGSADPSEPVTPRNEVALFYVLIGSSLGARHMLRQRAKTLLPQGHLQVLAEQGGALWREFTENYLARVPAAEESDVLNESRNIFESLYQRIRRAG